MSGEQGFKGVAGGITLLVIIYTSKLCLNLAGFAIPGATRGKAYEQLLVFLSAD